MSIERMSLMDRITLWLHGDLPLFYLHRDRTAFGRLLNWTALRYERRHPEQYDAILKP